MAGPAIIRVEVAGERDLRRIAAIHVDSWQDAFRGIVPDAVLTGHSVERSLELWRGNFDRYPGNLTIARQGDSVVGFCCAGPAVNQAKNAPFEFQIYALHTSPALRRRGIGAALLRQALARCRAGGMTRAIVWTLDQLVLSRRFYEREGGQPAKTGVWTVGEFTLPEVAHGWTFAG